MQLSVNYSPQAAEVVGAGAIDFDCWKCSDWPELIAGARETGLPHYVHFDLNAGPGTLEANDLGRVADACAETNTFYVNLHVSARRVDYPDISVESRDPAEAEAVRSRVVRDMHVVATRFGPERVIVENLPYRGPEGTRLRLGQDPAFLCRLCEEIGCGFLLDIAHARTAAHYLGLDERAYLSSLPVNLLRELHVSGVDQDDQGRLREHMPLTEDDWTQLAWVLDEIVQGQWAHPWALAFEYGGIGPLFAWRSDAAVLAAQVPRLHSLIQDKGLGRRSRL